MSRKDLNENVTTKHSALNITSNEDGVRIMIILGDEPDGTFMYFHDAESAWGAVDLFAAEVERIETEFLENPPEPEYGDDW